MKLPQIVHLVIATAFLIACQSGGVGQVMRNGMPAFARVIQIETELEEADLSRQVLATLEDAGYRCSGSLPVRTEPRMSGSVWARAMIEIEGSFATASCEWAVPSDDELFWRVARNAEGSAEEVFLDLCRLMNRIPNVAVSYRFE